MEQIFQYIGKIFITIALAIAGIFGSGVAQAPAENVGAAIPIPVAVFQTSLQSSITSSATSMTLVSGTDKSGDALAGYICFNIDEGTATEEFVCGTASGTAVTGMIRGLDPVDGDLEVTALKKAHRRGASVKVTNYPSLGILSRILNGTETLPNAITYASGIGPTASSDLADKEYVLSVVSGGTVTFEKVVVSGNAGETVAAGNLVYLKSTDSEWYKTDADTAATVDNVILGIAQGAGTDGNPITGGILRSGTDSNQSGLTPNTIYYAGNTAGAIASSAGTTEVTAGVAMSTTTIAFAPRFDQQITEKEQDAMAGGGALGTPSSTNKFQTQDGVTAYSLAITDPVIRVYTANDTWTKPANLEFVIVEVLGGGGGGGGATASDRGCGGGGGGGYSREKIAVATLGATETVTVGGGGAGATAGTGTTGTTSTFGALTTGAGGVGGTCAGASSAGGAGGAGSGGDLNVEGGDGGNGSEIANSLCIGGHGGNSYFGSGAGNSATFNGGATGSAGNPYGGGGGGGCNSQDTDSPGGAGGAGVVIVTEYYY